MLGSEGRRAVRLWVTTPIRAHVARGGWTCMIGTWNRFSGIRSLVGMRQALVRFTLNTVPLTPGVGYPRPRTRGTFLRTSSGFSLSQGRRGLFPGGCGPLWEPEHTGFRWCLSHLPPPRRYHSFNDFWLPARALCSRPTRVVITVPPFPRGVLIGLRSLPGPG